jgi:trehalose 6-phosphate phosphatase
MTTRIVPDAFWTALARARNRVLFLDYDGTLAPFRVERDEAVPYPGVRDAIAEIIRMDTRVVIISGRPVDEVISIIKLKPIPEVWGSHGLERLSSNGSRERIQLSDEIHSGLRGAASIAAQWLPPERIEAKYGCLAIHWRGLSKGEIQHIKENIEHAWRNVADHNGFDIHQFDGGIELRTAGRDKGFAVRTVLDETGVGTVASYLGDDQTDEDGFEAVNERNGLSILVRPESRETKAKIWLRPPEELIAFLATWLKYSRREKGGA